MTIPPPHSPGMDRYLAGEANAADAKALLARCIEDEEFLNSLTSLKMIERLLRFHHGATAADLFAAETVKRLELSGPNDQFVARVLPRLESHVRPNTVRTRRMPWLIPLAAAAAVLATVGLLFLKQATRPEPTHAIGRISRAIGPVNIADLAHAGGMGSTLSTGSNGLCRIEQADGAILAVARNTTVDWRQDPATHAKTLELKTGQTYLDLPTQQSPYLIRLASGAQAEIMGTRLLLNERPSDTFCSVFQGAVRFQNGPSSFLLEAGETARPLPSKLGGRLTISRSDNPMTPGLDWLNQLGIAPANIPAATLPSLLPSAAGDLALDPIEIPFGSWKRGQAADGAPTWIQDDPNGGADILFGNFKWLSGRISTKFKITRVGVAPEGFGTGIQILLGHEEGSDGFGPSKSLAWLMEKGGDCNLAMSFEVNPARNETSYRDITIWSDADPGAKGTLRDFHRSPANSVIKKRSPCRLGVRTLGCAAVFWDLRLENAVHVGDLRPSMGMLACYDFRGVRGRSVPDSSDVPPAMDLTIGRSDMVERTTGGLRVRGAADIAVKGELPKLRQGWARNRGLTLEIYAHPAVTEKVKAGGFRKLACVAAGDGSTAWIYDGGSAGSPPKEGQRHLVFVFDDSSGKLVQDFYQDGIRESSQPVSQLPFALDRRPGSAMELNLTPSRNSSSGIQDPWQGELIFMAVYDRALQPTDVMRLNRFGLPTGMQAAARGELWPWVAAYYRQHDRWLLQREKFTEGAVFATLPPSRSSPIIREGAGEITKTRRRLKDGQEGAALLMTNPDPTYCTAEFRFPGDLPDAFAVEIDLMPVKLFPAPGQSTVAGPFMYRDELSNRTDTVNLASQTPTNIVTESFLGPVDGPALSMGRWGQYRVQYFRVGRLPTGEGVFETRLPAFSGSGIRLTAKKDGTLFLSFRGCQMLVGEIRARHLTPPPGLGK